MQILWLPEVNMTLLTILMIVWLIVLLLCTRFNVLKPSAFFLAGILYALSFCYMQLQDQLQTPSNQDLTIRIDSLPKMTQQKTSFIGTDLASGRKLLLSQYAQSTDDLTIYKTGHIYQLNANLKPPHGAVNGIGFDREKWLFRNGIDGIGNIKSVQADSHRSFDFKSLINQWRSSLSQLINQHFQHPKANAMIHALSIGDKSHFEHQDKTMFQNTGTAHLIAISGLHVGMVAYLGWLMGGMLFKLYSQLRYPKPVFQIISGLLLAALYACLAGLAVSTLRALIMLLVYGLYKLGRRSNYAWDVWSVSLFLVLLVDPLNVLDGGFWLSFTAVAVLILAFNGTPKHTHSLINFISMQWTLLLGMMPLSLALFSRVNLMAPVVNLIMIPIMTFILIPLILMLILIGSLWGTFPGLLVNSINWVSQFSIQILSWFNQFSTWSLSLSIQHGWQYVVLILAAILLVLPRAIPHRILGIPLIVLGLYSPIDKIPEGQFKAQFLDVGQGLSILLQTQNHTLLYDVGAAYDSGFNMADAVILPFLQQQQIKAIDTLVLSHQDNDHSGAAEELQAQIPIKQILGTAESHQPCVAGTQWNWDQVKFTLLSPNNLTPYLKNNSSCVLQIEALETRLLLTGDIESPVEYRLSKMTPEIIQSDVLLVPHHGSNTSSTTEFLQAINPKVAINSSGQYNPFGHPTNAVQSRYQQLGIQLFDTQTSGLINMTTFPELTISSLRQLKPRIWRKKKPE
ncbi:MAG: DNA internalization-related competence protein ComEC/Rec2 [Marinicella sp.]